jgi:hypothetical protein
LLLDVLTRLAEDEDHRLAEARKKLDDEELRKN